MVYMYTPLIGASKTRCGGVVKRKGGGRQKSSALMAIRVGLLAKHLKRSNGIAGNTLRITVYKGTKLFGLASTPATT